MGRRIHGDALPKEGLDTLAGCSGPPAVPSAIFWKYSQPPLVVRRNLGTALRLTSQCSWACPGRPESLDFSVAEAPQI